jgi:hypothetical protein
MVNNGFFRTQYYSDGKIQNYMFSGTFERKFKHLLKTSSTHVHSTFEQLKTAFVTAPVLAFPNFDLPFTVQCDASNVALGAVIGQIVDDWFRPVMYGNRHLSEPESRYRATEREMLAIVWASKRFNCYIYGRPVTFVTHHEPLEPMGRTRSKISMINWSINPVRITTPLICCPVRPSKPTQSNCDWIRVSTGRWNRMLIMDSEW